MCQEALGAAIYICWFIHPSYYPIIEKEIKVQRGRESLKIIQPGSDRENNLNLHQREASESKRQIAVISIFTVIYFGYINNKMKSFKTDLNFVIDPIPADGAPHGSRC